jgi:hypothetical protein
VLDAVRYASLHVEQGKLSFLINLKLYHRKGYAGGTGLFQNGRIPDCFGKIVIVVLPLIIQFRQRTRRLGRSILKESQEQES